MSLPTNSIRTLIDLYPLMKTGEAFRADTHWVIEAMEIYKTAAEEVYRHLHPEITEKATRGLLFVFFRTW